MGTLCTSQRWAVEKKVLAQMASNFRAYEGGGTTRVEGWHTTAARNRYKLQMSDLSGFPLSSMSLYVASPHTLPKYDGGTINSVGSSHRCHTLSNGPDGCVQICHCKSWDASKTLWSVLFKGIIWLEAYEVSRASGRSISDIFDELKRLHQFSE